MEANFVEIYNETIRDLLASPNSNVKHEIKMVDAKSSEVMVSNLTRPTVTSQEQVSSAIPADYMASVIYDKNQIKVARNRCSKHH